MIQRRTAYALACSLSALVLAGCAQQPSVQVRAEPTYQDASRAPLLQSSRDAVKSLLVGLDTGVTGAGPVLVATVVNVNDLSVSAPLGRTLSEQYANAMAMTGFDVKEIKLRGDVFVKEGAGELLLSREIKDIARFHNASMVLVGTFSPAANYTYVSLKLVRTEDSRIIRGHDYALPNDRDVNRLLALPR
ncbi:FlgO family outer membrane protein [Pulveribacter sp.]|uniref:FlgO family outer membrane protein n=1 Tax=Pulveribacter sp. TaxID=2678893 RepID=UPI00289ECD07|nr:FlgO family outer membrane protein [Pulveribacter sp.]